jgi:hypothetical protein
MSYAPFPLGREQRPITVNKATFRTSTDTSIVSQIALASLGGAGRRLGVSPAFSPPMT